MRTGSWCPHAHRGTELSAWSARSSALTAGKKESCSVDIQIIWKLLDRNGPAPHTFLLLLRCPSDDQGYTCKGEHARKKERNKSSGLGGRPRRGPAAGSRTVLSHWTPSSEGPCAWLNSVLSHINAFLVALSSRFLRKGIHIFILHSTTKVYSLS